MAKKKKPVSTKLKQSALKPTFAKSGKTDKDLFKVEAIWDPEERWVSVDEKTAVFQYRISPTKLFKDPTVALNVQLEVESSTIAEQMIVGAKGTGPISTYVGHSDTPGSWVPLVMLSPALRFDFTPIIKAIEIRTGIFAGLFSGSGTNQPSVTAADVNSATMQSAEEQAVCLKLRVSWFETTGPVKHEFGDADQIDFDIVD